MKNKYEMIEYLSDIEAILLEIEILLEDNEDDEK